MRTRLFRRVGFLVATLFSLACVFSLAAKDKAPKPPKMSNVQGRVQMMSKDTSTITVEANGARREVVYSADTKFLYGHSKKNKPGSLDQVKEGNYISCAGTFSGIKLTAKECIYREQK